MKHTYYIYQYVLIGSYADKAYTPEAEGPLPRQVPGYAFRSPRLKGIILAQWAGSCAALFPQWAEF